MRRSPPSRLRSALLCLALALLAPLSAGEEDREDGADRRDSRRDGQAIVGSELEGVAFDPIYRWRAGDRLAWAAPELDPAGWVEEPTGAFPAEWSDATGGLGWLRFRLRLSPSLHGEILGLALRHEGAAEVYVDGELAHRFGRVGTHAADDEIDRTQDPRPLIFLSPDEVEDAGPDGPVEHVIAVRYSSRHLRGLRWAGREPHIELRLGELRPLVERRVSQVRLVTVHQMLLTGIALAFALVHGMLVVFRPRSGPNLYFAIMALVAAATVFLMFGNFIQRSPGLHLLYFTFYLLAFVGLALASLRFTHSLFYPERPRIFVVFALVALGLWIYIAIQPMRAEGATFLFMLAANLEIVRTLLASWLGGRKAIIGGAWILGVGALPIVVVSPYQLLVGLEVLPQLWDFLEFPAPYYAMLVLMFSMSVYLGRDFARTQERLERQLRRVQLLSEEKLEQERLAREKEVERARLEVENRRRAAELEEARRLQVSMLPEKVPEWPGLVIAAHLVTATEVGGDYYDFLAGDDGSLTVILGDATGHGAQAGTLVAATKGMLWTGAPTESPAACLARVSAGLRNMGLRRRHMALAAASFDRTGRHLVVSAAAMPPILVYRAAEQAVESIELYSLPLGSFREETYEEKRLDLGPRDRVVLMTDGLPETTDGEGASLGYAAVEKALRRHGRRTPEEIIEALRELAREWSKSDTPDDDLTVLVVGVRESAGAETKEV